VAGVFGIEVGVRGRRWASEVPVDTELRGWEGERSIARSMGGGELLNGFGKRSCSSIVNILGTSRLESEVGVPKIVLSGGYEFGTICGAVFSSWTLISISASTI